MSTKETVVIKEKTRGGRKKAEPVWAVDPNAMPTVEERADASGRKLRNEEIADWVMAGYYVVEGVFLAVAPTISMLRGKKSAKI